MDEKLTPADVIRRGIDAVAEAENQGLTVEKDAETSFTLHVEDDAIEFSSFSIDDNRDTTPGSKAGTRLPTVALPSAKVLSVPEEPVKEPAKEPVSADPVDEQATRVIPAIKETPAPPRHSKTWLKNHRAPDAEDVVSEKPEAKDEPKKERTHEDILAEILADTPEERRRREAAREDGRKLAEDIFSESPEKRSASSSVSEPTMVFKKEEIDQLAALERFDEEARKERRALRQAARAEAEAAKAAEPPVETDISSGNTGPSGYFGVNAPNQPVYMDPNYQPGRNGKPRKSGFKAEATANAAGGQVIESRSLAVDPTTLSKKELREYNRIARKGEKEAIRLQKKAEKRAGKKRMKVWQKVLIILLALIILVVAVAAIFFNRYYGLLGKLDIIGDNPISTIDVKDQSEANQETFNILLCGLDSRSDNYTGRSDSMILCTINKSSKKFVMTSFLRDSYVDIPGHGKDKLNAAYAYGGANLLTSTIYQNFGVVVDRTAVFNFIFVIDVIDYLGGVTVEVTQEELPYLNMYIHDQNEELYKSSTPNKGQITTGPGTYNLTGNQALAYARIRYVGTDFARSERQRLVLSECLNKAQKLSAGELNKMMTTFLPRIKTDLTQGDCASLIITLLRAGNYETGNMAIPIDGTWKDATVGDQEVLKITDFEANTKAWEEFVS